MLCQWLSFFFLLLLFSSFIYSNGVDTSIAYNCPTSFCHDIEIKYPFWRLDNYNSSCPQYCGYPGFGISCSDQANPRFYLSNESFYVKHINYDSHSLTLLDIGALYNSTCPRAHHNHTLEDKSPLKFSKYDIYLYFYYNCTRSLQYATSVDCLRSSDGRSSYVYAEHDELEDFNWHGICEDRVEVAVTDQGWNTRRPAAALGDGFVLDWQSAAECGQCEALNGFCGFNNSTKNMCFCKEGTPKFDQCNKFANKGRNRIALKIGIGIGAASFTALIAGVSFFIYHRRQKKKSYYTTGSSLINKSILSYPSSTKDPERAIGVHLFDYNELEEATNNFDSEKELGDGGYGTVYKGKLRDGRVVAVKRLYENNGRRVEQFMNEIEILSKLHHPNLVSLYGCTSRHSRELLLVYEYIPNGTIADHLHGGEDSKRGSLSWATRMKIAIETASALVYLHASDVIHRDVKTNNILLDDNFRVKVADFGLSRLFPAHATHVSTAPQGTPGYVDPEYHECYQLTDKSDVYSFGVVLIELISSLPAVDIFRHRHEINLSNMAINKIQSNALHELVDSNLGFDSNEKVRTMIAAVAELAFQCLQSESDMRPSMLEVLESLLRIQRMNKTTGKPENISPGEDIGFSKISTFVSPDSVTAKWSSNSTTPNAST